MVTVASSNILSESLLRYSTYSYFPEYCPFSASCLSSAGFSYGGKGHIVTCSACGLKEGNWDGTEAPLLVHARKSPFCPLIQSLCKTDSYDDMKFGSKWSKDVEQFETTTSDNYDTSANSGNFLLKLEPKPATKHLASKNEVPNHKNNTKRISAISSGNGSYDSTNSFDSNSSTTQSGNFHQRPKSLNSLPSSSSIIPYINPRYSHYTSMIERLKTFNNWSSSYPQFPEILARAGFFYTGINDLVRCYHCGGSLKNWEAEDSPWFEHAHWFPQCTYLRQNNGDKFIRSVHSMVGELTEESNHKENTGDVLGVSATSSNYNTPETETDIGGLISDRSGDVHQHKCSINGDVDNKDFLLCKVCLEKDVSIVFLPCGHLATCGQCAPAIQRCPICRQHILGSVKTYLTDNASTH